MYLLLSLLSTLQQSVMNIISYVPIVSLRWLLYKFLLKKLGYRTRISRRVDV